VRGSPRLDATVEGEILHPDDAFPLVAASAVAATTEGAEFAVDAAVADRDEVVGGEVAGGTAGRAPRLGGDGGAGALLIFVPVAAARGVPAGRAVGAGADHGAAAEAASC